MTDRSPAVSRRTLAKGAAWTVPAISIAAAAPSLAASGPVRIDPGINGWVLNSPRKVDTCKWTLDVDSTLARTGPDGAPFGLYLYDIKPQTTVANATLTYWIIGNQSATWTAQAGHSRCWSGPSRGTAQKKSDGFVYTPYTWTYTCPINSADVSSDGRLRLGGFHVRAAFTQSRDYCNDVTYWTQRTIVVDPDGAGSQTAQTLTFERRNGTRGPKLNLNARSAAPASTDGAQVS